MAEDEALVPRRPSLPLTPDERLAAQFYEWEQRGRGWTLWEYPVALEPPFRPFLFHSVEQLPMVDDARKPSFLGLLVGSIFGSGQKANTHSNISLVSVEPDEPLAEPFDEEGELVELRVAVPPNAKIVKESAERFLLTLTYASRPLSFEIIGSRDAIVVQFTCRKPDETQLRQQLKAHFPESPVTAHPGYLEGLWDRTKAAVVVDFGLSHEFMLPLRTFSGFDADPIVATVGALADLLEHEVAVFQVLFQAARHPWAESITRAVTDWEGSSFFADAPQMLALAKEKVSLPLFAGVIRIAARSPSLERAWQTVKAFGGALKQFATPTSNELIPLTNAGYPDENHAVDLLRRRSRRSGMILNADELVSLVHPPSASVRSAKLVRQEKKSKAAPAVALGHGIILGDNLHDGNSVRVTLNAEQRMKHTYVVGASGTGKSTLLLNLIIQDIENGEGVAVLDPHGDLIEELLGRIPESRIDDTVLFDPSDEEFPVGLNILSAHSELEKNLLGSDLIAVFQRLSTSWGDQMTSVLGNSILAFLESSEGGTLVDLRRFLIEPSFRQSVLKTVRDPEVVYYWEKSFPFLVGKPQGPILTRLDTFLRPKLVRNMVAQKENKLDLSAVMNGRKIFLAKLAQGAIGEENAYLLGTLLVSKFHQLAMSRQQTAAAERENFYLYIDEFHNFVTPSMAAILSGARKYRLGLILAHQELQQLRSRSDDVASAVISNPYTRICFRLGDIDAKKLEDGFSYFDARDLQNLEVGEAICRMEQSEYDFNLKTFPLSVVVPETAKLRTERVIALSRERYAARREEVEVHFAMTARPAKVEQQISEKPAAKREEIARLVAAPSEPVVVKVESQPLPTMPEPQTLGRGGPQHKYLQELIKRWADSNGYRTIIEKKILDGLGSVDVALEKDGRTIACEISISTSADHEARNVQKCLAAGFDHVILVASEKTILGQMNARISTAISADQYVRIRTVLPDQVFACIASLETKAAPKVQDNHDGKELLTAKEVEALLRIDVKTIYSYVQRDMIPYVRMQSNLRFLKSEILAWMAEQRSSAKSGASKKK